MAAIPTSKRETSLSNPLVPEIIRGLCLAVTKYDGVMKDTGKGPKRFKPLYSNLHACILDCLNWQETLFKFGAKHQNMMFLHNPSFKMWTETILELNRAFKRTPNKLSLIMHCYAGHGMCKDGRQVILIN